MYNKYIAEVKKKYSSCDVYEGSIFFGCVIKNLDDVKGFPELSIVVGENTFNFGRDKFVTSFKAGDYYIGMAMIDKIDGDYWLVGSNFMRDRYIIFNCENKTIGISGADHLLSYGFLLTLMILL